MYSARLGFRVTEVLIVFRDRIYGRSKLTWRDVGEFFITMWRLRRAKPGDPARRTAPIGSHGCLLGPLEAVVKSRTATAGRTRANSK